MRFDFWDNYHNMLDIIIWKKKFILPVIDNPGVPLRLISINSGDSKVWALMSRVEGEIQIDNIEIDYSKRDNSLNRSAMTKLVEAYFEAYADYLTGEKPQ